VDAADQPLAPRGVDELQRPEHRDHACAFERQPGRIVAEVILALIALDRHSFLSQNPAFTPVLDSAKPGTFTFADLITVAVKQRAMAMA